MSIPQPGSTRPWSGRAVTEARAIVATWLPQPCGQCGHTVDGAKPWVIGHIEDRATHPHLTWVMSNWRVEHRACSNRSAQGVVIAKAKHDALRDAGVLPHADPTGKPPILPVSPPEPPSQPALSGLVLPFPTGKPMETRPDLAWSPGVVLEHPWLAEFAEVPDNAAPPLWMSPVPLDAVCSYAWSGCTHIAAGEQAIPWIEREHKIRLRWWQRLAVSRQLEHREDGSLCAREYIESAPRRAGKSVRMKGTATWRLAQADLFGETQLVMHTGSDMAICREIQRQAWRWAEGKWGKNAVTRANGKESIETLDGDRWLVRSQEGVYGYDVTYGMGDECWNVQPGTISEGIEPATLERVWPQIALTSTAHRRATSLMRGRISTALAVYSPEVVLLVWAAPPGSDPADPDAWRAASPHWSEDRHRLIERKYEAALAGQSDPQADDPDPLAGFTSQYLNVWRLTERALQKGDPVTTEDAWGDLVPEDATQDGPPHSIAIESWFAAGVSVACAWRTADGAVLVKVTDHPNVEHAAAHARTLGRRRPTVGKSLLDHPALRGLQPRAGEGNTGQGVQRMLDHLRDGVVRHDGGEHLTGQILAARVTKGSDGPRLVGGDRADAIKAAAWAIAAARRRVGTGPARIILPSSVRQ